MALLNVIYRGCNLENPNAERRQGRPEGFSKMDCFYTFHRSVCEFDKIGKVFVVIDGDKGYLSDYIESFGYDIIYLNYKSNVESLKYVYELAEKLDDNNNIYFLEDDYWHNTPKALEILNEGIDCFGLVSGYDHPDKYTRTDDITIGKEFIKINKHCHWRTAESTTATFGISRELYNKVGYVARQELAMDRNFFRRLIIEHDIRLHTPIPAVSTHVFLEYYSPFFKFK